MSSLSKITQTAIKLLSLSPVLVIAFAGYSLVLGEKRDGFPNSDLVIYAIIAKLWNHGVIPYRDIADHKPPVIYLFLRLCFLFGGNSAVSMWRGFVILTMMGAGSLFLGFRSARMLWVGIATALAFVFFFLLNPLSLPEPAFLNTEQLSTGLLALAYGVLIVFTSSQKVLWGVLSGSLFSLAVLAKQPAAFFALPFLTHLLFYPWGPQGLSFRAFVTRFMAVGVGGVIPVILFVSYFAFHNALKDLWYWTYTANLYYAPINRLPRLYVYGMFLENSYGVLRYLSNPAALPYKVALSVPFVLLVLRRSWVDVVACSWVVAAFASLVVNIQSGHAHYFLFFQTPLGIALGVSVCGVAYLVYRIISFVHVEPRLEWGLALAICLWVFYPNCKVVYSKCRRALTYPQESMQGGAGGVYIRQLSEKINPTTNPPAYMFYYGQDPAIFFYGNFKPTSKFIYPMSGGIGDGFKNDLVSSAQRFNAPYGYFTHDVRPENLPTEGEGFAAELGRLLRQNYELLFPVPGGYVYRRKDIPPPA